MHEMGIVQSIIGILDDQAEIHKARKINKVCLEFGALTAVMPEAVQFAFDVLSRGTVSEGAELDIHILPVKMRCLDCGAETQTETFAPSCPSCASTSVLVIQGKDEIRIASIEIDDGDD